MSSLINMHLRNIIQLLFFLPDVAQRYCTSNGTWFIHPSFNKTWTDYTKCPYKSPLETIPELIRVCILKETCEFSS
jgi:hypothetical protein